MDLKDWLLASSAVASALFALGALAVSIWSVVRSTKAGKGAQAARELAGTTQWKMTDHLQVIAESQAKLAHNLGTDASAGQAALTSRGGRLSARLVRMVRSDRLLIANVGVKPVEVISVDVPAEIAVNGAPSIEGVELDPGEDFGIVVDISMGTSLPVTVTMRWRDSGGEHELTQEVTLS